MDKERLLELVINLLENKKPDNVLFRYAYYNNDKSVYRINFIESNKSIEVALFSDYTRMECTITPSEKDFYKIKWLIESYSESYEQKLISELEEFSKPENPVDELLSNPNE